MFSGCFPSETQSDTPMEGGPREITKETHGGVGVHAGFEGC